MKNKVLWVEITRNELNRYSELVARGESCFHEKQFDFHGQVPDFHGHIPGFSRELRPNMFELCSKALKVLVVLGCQNGILRKERLRAREPAEASVERVFVCAADARGSVDIFFVISCRLS